MKNRVFTTLLTAAGLAFWLSGAALDAASRPPFRPFLHTLFTDHMVFPREVEAPIWGWTEPGAKVIASMLDKSAEAIAGTDGKWLLKLGPFPAGGPFKLTVTGPKATVTLDDVLIGDVWLCSGQSNMTMGITVVNNAQEEIANATHPRLRLFDQPPFLREGWSCKWSLCTPEQIVDQSFATEKLPDGKIKRVGFSAAAYFFGRDLQKEIDIPIGLVQTSAPGTFIEMWSSLEVLAPFVRQEDQALDAWFKQNDPGTPGWANPGFDDSAWKTMTYPLSKDTPAPKFSGILWFRKTFELPAELEGKEMALGFGWMGGLPGVWLNDEFLGNLNPDGSCVIPATLLKAGRNSIAVRVLNIHGRFGFCTAKPEEMRIEETNGKGTISLAGDWRYQAGRAKTEFASEPPPVLLRHADAATGGGSLFRDLIRPLVPFAFKGVVWYQGEANKAGAKVYSQLLTALIADWRGRFPVAGKLPFLIVQLPNFVGHNRLDGLEIPNLRAAQAEVAKTVPDVAMAVAADIGEEQNEHPKNKQEVGRRLALKALETVYDRKIDSSGPVYKSMAQAGSALRLSFDHAGEGLVAKNGELKGFTVAGADGKFVQATAAIEGGVIVVSAPGVSMPVAVRYGWANWSPCDLYNQAGLPAEPFCDEAKPPNPEWFHNLYARGDNGYKVMRIPAVVRTKKDTLLTFCEGRVDGSGDHGNIDLVTRRSVDGGTTWGKLTVVHDEGKEKKITIGNPCAVVDHDTGTVFLTFCRDNRDVLVTRSDDDGLTWAAPIEITASLKEDTWGWFATGPGHGIQITRGKFAGRLIIPCDCEDTAKVGGLAEKGYSFVVFSDDHGVTWKRGGVTEKGMNECEVVERSDGSLLLSMRNYRGTQRRAFAASTDGGMTWSSPQLHEQVYCSTCQASILRYSFEPRSILLYSGPANGRREMTVRASFDEGRTWPVAKLLYDRQASYSDLVVLPNGKVGCIVERDDHTVISFAQFSLEWLFAK